MVHLELGQSNAALLKATADLAGKFQAGVIGIAASQLTPMLFGDGYGYVSADVIEQFRDEAEEEIKAAEAEFRAALQSRVDTLGWRADVTFDPLPDYIARQARCADLVITGIGRDPSLLDSSRQLTTSDLVMRAGRPVLVVPATKETLSVDRVVVGWKDTRETRRAIVDALPLLKKASNVAVIEIADAAELPAARERVEDVAGWLTQHAIPAEAIAVGSTGGDAAQLDSILDERHADLLVAGAYGHSRVREWVLGGVTRDLLLKAKRCAFVSH
ncbi:MAG TPA: universal stress protein [Aliidongia sp.]|nr:universal stress protein [Aliidongia sp.]